MDGCLEVQQRYHRSRVPGRKRGREFQASGGLLGGRSHWAPLAVFGGGWEAMAFSDMCHKCLAPAWLLGSVTVVGRGSCGRGSSSGSGAVIVRGAWKRQKRPRRLEGDLVPPAPYQGSPFHQCPLPLSLPPPPPVQATVLSH